jgi:hypothetical protein
MHRTLLRSVTVLAAAVFIGGCEDTLVVQNPNQGETDRVLATPADAENLLGSYYKRWHSGVYGSTTNLEGMGNIWSLMNYSSLANNGQNSHAPFSGGNNYNQPGNVVASEQFRLYTIMSEVNRVGATFAGRITRNELNLGTPARNQRAVAFAEFLTGISLGYLAMVHDSAAVVSHATGSQDIGSLVGYRAVADSAMAALQRAIDAANAPATGGDGFPLPATWIPSPTNFTTAEFVRLVRSYRARIRASVARTPTERAAADWAAIIADAQNGITADHQITTSTTVGPGISWRSTYGVFRSWHQMPPFFIGMADGGTSYAAWLATPLGDRGAGNVGFFMVSPDLRFPQGATRTAQQADFALSQCSGPSQTCKRYFVNRPAGVDEYSGNGWGWSNYDHARYYSWRTSGAGTQQNGPTPMMHLSEIRLLEAEGHYRAGNFAAAGALVNMSRTAGMTVGTNPVATGGGLPPITVFDATTPVPGGAACVPKVPQAPTATNPVCGNLWEALKYEKRIETAYSHYMPWYFDNRGWGDLPQTTPLFWAVPFQELQSRNRPISAIYGAGIGSGNAPNSAAGPSTYGW